MRDSTNSTETLVTDVILLGFPELCHLRELLLGSFFTVYMVTVLENLVIVVTIRASRPLHTPMYYFLANLSVLETLYTSVTIPKLLAGLLVSARTISFSGCLTQLFLFLSLGSSECLLLATMACDRYLAICPNVLNNFFCDISPLLQLCCSGTVTIEVLDFVAALAVLAAFLPMTVVSYAHIVAMVLSTPGGAGRQKAFSTCASHLALVAIFYTTTIFMYAWPHAVSSFDFNKLVSIVYLVVTPRLSPVIYCLQNHDIREALAQLHQAPGPS
ncbi:hypothetical protein J1605_015132 [Eschrichtius robustus]|uniref:G-protein coupled receptors family 1 profile domain-containing protein n=1 Tax=Eschrichtius robustus TaxID=9764 RepID=A0AB34GCH4_ESCRO|nr:hypothetical protein J1605_015132 [Eschrichtius robustus]